MKLAAILTNIRTQVIEFMNERFWLKELVFKFLLGKLKELKIIFAQHCIDYYSSKQVFPSPSQQVFPLVIIFYYQSMELITLFLHEKYNHPQHLSKHDVTISGIQ